MYCNYKQIAKDWLQDRYERDLEDVEILELLQCEQQNSLLSALYPIDATNLNKSIFFNTRYLMITDLYNKVKKELES